jgi:WhiB family redox-sensing transcriptional regulator
MTTMSAYTLTRPVDTREDDRDEDWRLRGACFTEDPELFFPATGTASASQAVRDAAWEAPRAICRRCPVRDECLAQSLDDGDTEGMFGGLTPDERRAVGRRRARRRTISGAL